MVSVWTVPEIAAASEQRDASLVAQCGKQDGRSGGENAGVGRGDAVGKPGENAPLATHATVAGQFE
jgi:hypothetical protein